MKTFKVKLDGRFVLDKRRFDSARYIAKRLNAVPPGKRRCCLKSLLSYIYSSDGPGNMPKERFSIAYDYLNPPEKIVAKWLRTRTNGRHRGAYGKPALLSARKARFRCQKCGFPDVRTLHLDHVEGRIEGASFACLCANCHNIKSRKKDWSGHKREQPE